MLHRQHLMTAAIGAFIFICDTQQIPGKVFTNFVKVLPFFWIVRPVLIQDGLYAINDCLELENPAAVPSSISSDMSFSSMTKPFSVTVRLFGLFCFGAASLPDSEEKDVVALS